MLLSLQAHFISQRVLFSSPIKLLLASVADKEFLQDSQGGVPVNIHIQEDETVGGASVASQGTLAMFQCRARCTLLEIKKDEVFVCKGDRGLPGSKVSVTNQTAETLSLTRKFLGSFHLQSKNAAGKNVQKSKHI